MLITSYKIGGVHFRFLGTNGFHVKAKNERFTAASSRCRQNLKYENFTSSFGSLRQNIAPKSVPHVQHDHFSSFNQWNHWFVALSLTLPSSNFKLPIRESTTATARAQINALIGWKWKNYRGARACTLLGAMFWRSEIFIFWGSDDKANRHQ